MNATPLRLSHPHRFLLVGLAVALALLIAPVGAQAGWRKTGTERGVTLYDEPDEDRAVPRFKGVMVIDASVEHLLAILADMERATEWNSKLIVSDVLARRSDLNLRFYWRFKAPWPVDDRDGVLESKVTREGDDLVAGFHTVPGPERAVPSGVTRFGHLRGHFRLTRLGPERTRVEHLVDADPAGNIPSWLVQYVTEAIPVDSLTGMKRQAAKTRGHYDDFIRRNAPQPAAPAGAGAGAATPAAASP